MWQGPLAVPGGDRQSPIDIVVRKSIFDSKLKPLVPDYDPKTCQQIWNNGYSFLVEYDDTTDKSSKCFEKKEKNEHELKALKEKSSQFEH